MMKLSSMISRFNLLCMILLCTSIVVIASMDPLHASAVAEPVDIEEAGYPHGDYHAETPSSFLDVLEHITAVTSDNLDDVIARCNPTSILARVNADLGNLIKSGAKPEQEKLVDLLQRAVFSFYFHWNLTGELVTGFDLFKGNSHSLFHKGPKKNFEKVAQLKGKQKKVLKPLFKRTGDKINRNIANPTVQLSNFFLQQNEDVSKAVTAFKRQLLHRYMTEERGASRPLDFPWFTQLSPVFCDEAFNRLNVKWFLICACHFKSQLAGRIVHAKSFALYTKGHNKEAGKYCKQAAYAGDVDAMHNLGVRLQEEENCGAAIAWYRKAARGGHAESMHNLGVLLTKKAETKNEGITWLRKILRKHEWPVSMNALGDTLVKDKSTKKEGKKLFLTAATKHDDPEGMHNLGVLFEDEGRIDDARTWYTKAVKFGYSHALNNLGCLLEKEKNVEGAKKVYRQGIEEYQDPVAMYNLALLLCRAGNIDEAIEHYRVAARDHQHPPAMNNLSLLLVQKGKTKEALYWLRRAAVDYKKSLAMLNLARYLVSDKNTEEEAIGFFLQAIECGEKKAHLHLARLSYRNNDFAGTEKHFLNAIACGVEDADVLYEAFLLKQGRLDEAEEFAASQREDEEPSDESDEADELDETEVVTVLTAVSGTVHEDKNEITDKKEDKYIPDFSESDSEESYSLKPTLSKKQQRVLDRAKKAEERLKKMVSISSHDTKTAKTYLNVTVTVVPGIEEDVRANELRIKQLLSYLSNGETRRARFEYLKGNNLCSMCIDMKDGKRLVFEITEGSIFQGVRGIKILDTAHYDQLERSKGKNTAPSSTIPFSWSKYS